MTMPSSPHILDVTVRGLSNRIFKTELSKKVGEIARELIKAGLSYAEICHDYGVGAKGLGLEGLADDEELLEASIEAAPGLTLSVFIPVMDFSLAILPGLISYFEIGRIGVNVDEIFKAEKIARNLKKYEKKVVIQLDRCNALPPEITQLAARQATELGADIIYVVDTFGSMLPQEVKEYVSAVKSVSKAEIGFRSQNNSGLAIPNTLAAWEEGASWLDASLLGVGRGAGNCNLEALIALIQDQGNLKEVSLKNLCELTQEAVLPNFRHPPFSALINILFATEKIDFNYPEFLRLAAGLLHLSLQEMLTNLHAKMGKSLTLGESHLKALFKDMGVDFDKVFSSLREGK